MAAQHAGVEAGIRQRIDQLVQAFAPWIWRV